MRLEQVFVRFYRSFNYDYERKWHKSSDPEGWEDVSEGWFPFVRVKIDPEITAVIGANEAGKTQLLNTVESAVTGSNIDPSDFCRYSVFYSVQADEIRSPEFGATFLPETEEDLEVARTMIPELQLGEKLTLFHPGSDQPFLVVGKREERVLLTENQLATFRGTLPPIYKLETQLAMPDSMSIAELAGAVQSELHSRLRRSSFLRSITSTQWSSAEQFAASLFPSWQAVVGESITESEKRRRKEFELGRQLLVDIARIDPSSFERLQNAIEAEREGEIEGLVGAMNSAIAENLNFHRWWTQDTNFDIQVKAREHELALVITDRTKASYSFDERSQGLRYFLSYFVQLTAHRASVDRTEIMLLDEPDAYLSSVGQQDLLRVLQNYAEPESDAPRNQVIYVTHSPFLIDRNAGYRIRVLDKGAEDEGTRVIKDATQNHYEPLRTSLGSTIAETAFIGGKNLFVEGLADQVLLAGLSNHLSRTSSGSLGLNLNEVTIVASGSANSLPYMVYLARGRGGTLPPCVALLDADTDGKRAAEVLRKQLVHKRHVLSENFIVEFDTWAAGASLRVPMGVLVKEIEDRIPLPIAVDPARSYARTIEGLNDPALGKLTVESVGAGIEKAEGSLWDALAATYEKAFSGAHIEKVGFAREVVEAVGRPLSGRKTALSDVEQNFSLLITHLAELLDDADIAENSQRNQNRLARVVAGFERDHPDGIMKRRARAFVREMEQALDDSDRSDHIRVDLTALRRDFDLDGDLRGSIADFLAFRDAIRRVEVTHRTSGQEVAHAGVGDRTRD